MSKNYEFFKTLDVRPYQGEWIVIAGERLIGHAKNPSLILDQAEKEYPEDVAFLALIPGRETLHYHTWS